MTSVINNLSDLPSEAPTGGAVYAIRYCAEPRKEHNSTDHASGETHDGVSCVRPDLTGGDLTAESWVRAIGEYAWIAQGDAQARCYLLLGLPGGRDSDGAHLLRGPREVVAVISPELAALCMTANAGRQIEEHARYNRPRNADGSLRLAADEREIVAARASALVALGLS